MTSDFIYSLGFFVVFEEYSWVILVDTSTRKLWRKIKQKIVLNNPDFNINQSTPDEDGVAIVLLAVGGGRSDLLKVLAKTKNQRLENTN